MGKPQINRRDFFKLFALTSLAGLGAQGLSNFSHGSNANQISELPNIIIVVFDALSAKHVSTYGYHRDTTPNLTRFAEKATVFHRHYAAGNFTTPGTASLLTGTYPWSHGGYHLFGTMRSEYEEKNIFSLLSKDYFTSAFTRNAYARGLINQIGRAVDQFPVVDEHSLFSSTYLHLLFPKDENVAHWGEINLRIFGLRISSSPFLSSMINRWVTSRVDKETQKLKECFPRGVPTNLHGQLFILEDAIDWMIDAFSSAPKPFLGYFHLFPPHFPYRTRQEFNAIFDDGWQPIPKPPHFFTTGHSDEFLATEWRYYDEYIAYADAEFGRLIAELEHRGLLENTFLAFTSDHGEMFERGIFQHTTPTLYEPIVHIPLLLHKPKQSGRVDIFSPTSCVDLVPTFLFGIGQSIPDWCEGQVLPIFDENNAGISDRSIYAIEAKGNAKNAPLNMATVSLIKGTHKIVHYKGYEGLEDKYEVYDLEHDPEEMEDIYQTGSIVGKQLKDELDQKLSEVNQNISRSNE
jgi:arylsulfatase A-like enzyme